MKPKLALLKRTLLGTGGALAVCAVLLVGLIKSGADADGMYGELSGPPQEDCFSVCSKA